MERSGIVATYRLHDRVLSNRSSRRLYAEQPPALNALQQRIVSALDAEGYATVPFEELVADDELRSSVLQQGADFIDATRQGLTEESGNGASSELRRRPGKEFLVRAHSFDGVHLGPEHAWFRACLSAPMVNVANAYLRMWSKLSYVDLWYTVPQPGEAKRVASQLWHYDFDDKHLLKAFLYLDDVDAETGHFEYVAGSQPGGEHHRVHPWKPMGFGRVPEEEYSGTCPGARSGRSPPPGARSSSVTRADYTAVGSQRRDHACWRRRRMLTRIACGTLAEKLRRRPLPAQRAEPGGWLRGDLSSGTNQPRRPRRFSSSFRRRRPSP